jgi:hypothetical protein
LVNDYLGTVFRVFSQDKQKVTFRSRMGQSGKKLEKTSLLSGILEK